LCPKNGYHLVKHAFSIGTEKLTLTALNFSKNIKGG
jgi:hypothetical protein